MRKLLLGVAAAGVAALLIWQALGAPAGQGDPVEKTIVMTSYRAPLRPGEAPAGHVKNVDIVAVVTILRVEEPRWNSSDGKTPGEFIYTPVLVQAESYLKGDGPRSFRISQLGGTRDGVRVVEEDGYAFEAGMKAVVFLNPPGVNINGWTLENAYIITGDKAYSQWDQREMPVAELDTQLRQAAAAEAVQ